MPKIEIKLTDRSIGNAIKAVERYQAWVSEKEKELRSRLAMLGATVASIRFARAIYTGSNDITVRVDDTGSKAVIYAEGEALLFIEFGAGITYGYGHPQAGEFGYGPGTYSEDKDNWKNPKGWWFGSSQHTFGNPPAMAMYDAVQEIAKSVTEIAREVFRS